MKKLLYILGLVCLAASVMGQEVIITNTGGGGGSVSQPVNQVVYGTGTGVGSEAAFIYDPTTNKLTADTLRGNKVAGPIYDKGGAVYHVAEFGIVPDGTDQSDKLNRMDSILFWVTGKRGYTRQWGEGTYRLDKKIKYPTNYNGSNIPQIANIVERGVASTQSGNGQFPLGGTILDCRFVGDTLGAFDIRGSGRIEYDNIIFYRGIASSVKTPFIFTTMGTLHVHDCAFFGFGIANRNHAMVLGGDVAFVSPPDTASTIAFQGYGTVIEDNYFDRIEIGIDLRTYANSVFIHNNNWWNKCGGYCAIRMEPKADNDVGNVILANLIEMAGYEYGVVLGTRTSANTIAYNQGFDQDVQSKSLVWSKGTQVNAIYGGNAGGAKPYLKDTGGNAIFIPGISNDTMKLPVNIKVRSGNWLGTVGASPRTYAVDGSNSWADMTFSNTTRAMEFKTNILGVPKTIMTLQDFNPTISLVLNSTGSENAQITTNGGHLRLFSPSGKELWIGNTGTLNHLFLGGTLFGGVGGITTPFKLGQGQRMYWSDTSSPTAGSTIGLTSHALGRMRVIDASGNVNGSFQARTLRDSTDSSGLGGYVPTSTNTGWKWAAPVDPSPSNEGQLGVGVGGANSATIVSNTSGNVPVTIEGSTNVKVTENQPAGIITLTVPDTVFIKINSLSITDSLKTVSTLGADYFNVPAELAGFTVSKVEYSSFTAGAGSGSVTTSLRLYNAARTFTGSSNAVVFAVGDAIKTSTGAFTLASGQLIVPQITADTMTTHPLGLSVVLMLTK